MQTPWRHCGCTRPIHTVSFFNTMKRWGTGSRENFYSEMSNLRHLDLSRNKSLRTFETTAESVTAVASLSRLLSSLSHPLCSLMLLSPTGTPISMARHPGPTLIYAKRILLDSTIAGQRREPLAPYIINEGSIYFVRCMEHGSFGWCFARMLQIVS